MNTVVFGAGYWGSNFIRELGHHCVAVVDPNNKARARASARFGLGNKTYSSWETLCIDGGLKGSLEAAVVVTPPGSHYEIAKKMLDKGLYVLVEKPMAFSYKEAADLASYDRCMAGLVYLYHPSIQEMRTEFVHRGPKEISHAFSRRTNHGPIRPYKNALWDLAPHDISIFNYIFGSRPSEVRSFERQDWSVLEMVYYVGGCKIPTVSYVSWTGGPKRRLVEIVPWGEERIIFDDLQAVFEDPPLTRMVRAFLSKQWDRCTGKEGADVVWVLEEASK